MVSGDPSPLDRSVTAGLAVSIILLAVTVVLVTRLSGSPAAIVVALIASASLSVLFWRWYTHASSRLRQQDELVHRLQRDVADLKALDALTAAIQASRSVDALTEAVLTFVSAVFPGSAGTVATRSTGKDLELLATWGTGLGTVDRTGSCYAVRDRQTFVSDGISHGFRCPHVEPTYVGPYVCFPITGQVGAAGVLHLRSAEIPAATEASRRRHLGEAAASRIGIGLETLELHDVLRTQSLIDPLTGLPNRRALFDHAKRVHSQAIGAGGGYSVIVADVDRFKVLNDTLGHPAGDTILVTFARHLQRHIRTQDIACRYGGEEFVVVMPDASPAVASQRAESMRAALGSLRTTVPPSVWRLSASFGVATFPFDGNSFADTLRRADEAMYESKLAGRDRVTSASQRSRRA